MTCMSMLPREVPRPKTHGLGVERRSTPVIAYRGLNGGGVFSMITLPSGRIAFSCQNNGK
jgi:hypothetical protein